MEKEIVYSSDNQIRFRYTDVFLRNTLTTFMLSVNLLRKVSIFYFYKLHMLLKLTTILFN